jgi:multidrug efflux system outer membrane protein
LTEQAKVTFQQTVLTALQDVDSSVYAFAKEREHHDALSDAVKAYQQVVTLSLKLYRDGSTDFLNVITAQRSLYQAQDELAQSERAMSVDVVAVYKALGGGWNDEDVMDCYPGSVKTVDASAAMPASRP